MSIPRAMIPRALIPRALIAVTLIASALACQNEDDATEAPESRAAEAARIAANLETFDELDYQVFSHEEWDRLHESHAAGKRFKAHFLLIREVPSAAASATIQFYISPFVRRCGTS